MGKMGCGASSTAPPKVSEPQTAEAPAVAQQKHDMNKLVEYATIMAIHSSVIAEDGEAWGEYLSPEELEVVKELATKEMARVKKTELADLLIFPAQTAQLAVATGAIERGRIETALMMYRSGMREKAPKANDCFDQAVVSFRKEVVLRSASFKMDDTGIRDLVEKLFDVVDREKTGSIGQGDVAATVKLSQKWSEVGTPGWDTKKNLEEMLNPAWMLLAGSTKEKVTLHRVLKLISMILESVVQTSVSIEEIWALSVPVAMPKASQGVFEIFAAFEYDLDKNGTLSFDEAIDALEKTGLLEQLDNAISESKEAKEKMKEEAENLMQEAEADVLGDGTEESEGLFADLAKNIMDAQSAKKLVPKLKKHLEAMKNTSPDAMAVVKTFANGGITEEIFVDHVLKATKEAGEYGDDMAQGILDDIIIPSIRSQKVLDKEGLEALVEKAKKAFVALKVSMDGETTKLKTALA